MDVAPQHSSVLMGISNTVATIPGIVSPLLIGHIVSNGEDKRLSWQIVFYIAAGIYLFGCVIYWFFASGEVQWWAKVPTDETAVATPELTYPEKRKAAKEGIVNDSLELKE